MGPKVALRGGGRRDSAGIRCDTRRADRVLFLTYDERETGVLCPRSLARGVSRLCACAAAGGDCCGDEL
jgi:hypothetical protein